MAFHSLDPGLEACGCLSNHLMDIEVSFLFGRVGIMSGQFFMDPRASIMSGYYKRLVRTFSACVVFVWAMYVYIQVWEGMHACICMYIHP